MILVGSQKEKDQWKTQTWWEYNNKIDFVAIRWDCMDWVDLAQDKKLWRALVNTVKSQCCVSRRCNTADTSMKLLLFLYSAKR
jgi:hypothetical protein